MANVTRADVEALAKRLDVVHCVHCGRVYVLSNDTTQDQCVCGCEFYPVAWRLQLGVPLEAGDGQLVGCVRSHDQRTR